VEAATLALQNIVDNASAGPDLTKIQPLLDKINALAEVRAGFTPTSAQEDEGLKTDPLIEQHKEVIQAASAMQADIDRILARLDTEIPETMKEMDALLTRLRTTRIVVAA
jgi:hypothetical protein